MTGSLPADAFAPGRSGPVLRLLGAALVLWGLVRIALDLAFVVDFNWYGSVLQTLADAGVRLLPAAGTPVAAGLAFLFGWQEARRAGLTLAVLAVVSALGTLSLFQMRGMLLVSQTGMVLAAIDIVVALLVILILARLRPSAPPPAAAPPQRITIPGRIIGVFMALAGMSIFFLSLDSIGSAETADYWQVLPYAWFGRFIASSLGHGLGLATLFVYSLAISFGYGGALVVAGFGLALRRRWGRPIGAAIAAFGFFHEAAAIMSALTYRASGPAFALHEVIAVTCLVGFLYSLLPRPRPPAVVVAKFPEPPAVKSTIADDDAAWRAALLASLADTGQQPITRDALGVVLPIVAVIGIALLTALIDVFIREGFRNEPTIQYLAWYFWSAALVLVFGRAVAVLGRRIWRHRARRAETEIARNASRRPVLYLRAFSLDEVVAQPSAFELILGTQPTATAEQVLVALLGKVGPVIAIGRPGEKLPALGAARFYVDHDRWHLKVADVAKVARLVVWVTGTSDGLRWEIGHLLSEMPRERLIVWAHPHIMGGEADEREAEWSRFRDTLGNRFPQPFPKTLGDTRFFHFDPAGNPLPAAPPPRRWYAPWRWLRNPQRAALRALLIEKGLPPFDPPAEARRRRFRRTAVQTAGAAVILLAVTIAGLFAYDFFERSQSFAENRWNLLSVALVNAEVHTDGVVDANGSWHQTLRTPDRVREELSLLQAQLADHLFGVSWESAPYGQLGALRPVAKAYLAIFEAAHRDLAVERLLLARGSRIIVSDLSGPEDAQDRLDAVTATLAATDRFEAAWQEVPEKFRTDAYGPPRLEKLLGLRHALLEAQTAELAVYVGSPDAWRSTGGSEVSISDPSFAARVKPLQQAEIDAYTALVNDLNALVNG